MLQDENGSKVRIGQYFTGKPVVLSLVYYACPMLCNMTLNGLTETMEKMSLDLGPDYQVITVSFDERETAELARAKKASYVQKYGREGAADNWHFITGNAPSVRKVAESVGFH